MNIIYIATTTTKVPPQPFYIEYFPEIAILILVIPIAIVLGIGFYMHLLSFSRFTIRRERKTKRRHKKSSI